MASCPFAHPQRAVYCRLYSHMHVRSLYACTPLPTLSETNKQRTCNARSTAACMLGTSSTRVSACTTSPNALTALARVVGACASGLRHSSSHCSIEARARPSEDCRREGGEAGQHAARSEEWKAVWQSGLPGRLQGGPDTAAAKKQRQED